MSSAPAHLRAVRERETAQNIFCNMFWHGQFTCACRPARNRTLHQRPAFVSLRKGRGSSGGVFLPQEEHKQAVAYNRRVVIHQQEWLCVDPADLSLKAVLEQITK